MRFGVCYYPEQWPSDRWPVDASAMADAGVELVRIGEFAWSTYEPRRDQFEFDWLDAAIETLAKHGLSVVLGTPTATPPVWLTIERPDILSVGPDGRRRAYGSRRHTCPTSPAYREESERIVARLLARYATHPAIAAWQVDNEMGNHDSARCWCDACQRAFTGWLTQRFGTIDRLNEAWGTAFWSMTYPDFEAVRLPVPTMTSHHPALLLAHARFASQQALDYLAAQFGQIQAQVPAEVEVTTNFYSEDTAVDQGMAARLGGFAAIDNYPHGPRDHQVTAYLLDLARGATGRAWVMEQQPGPINWTPDNPPVPPGQVRAWTWQAAAHGYEAVLYFRWRAARHGQEIYHSGLLLHDGSPTPALAEAKCTIGEVRDVRIPAPRPTVAILHGYDDVWALDITPHQAGLTHRGLQVAAHQAARAVGLDVAVVTADTDLSSYDLVLAPALHIVTDQRLAAINRALEHGVTVVLGARSLVIDEEFAWSDEPLPAGLADRLGATVTEPLSQPDPVTVEPWGLPAGPWTDVLEPTGAGVVATYGGGTYLDGRAAAVRRGSLWYAGFSSPEAWTQLLAQITGREPQPPHLEVFERSSGACNWRVEIDHATITTRVTVTEGTPLER